MNKMCVCIASIAKYENNKVHSTPSTSLFILVQCLLRFLWHVFSRSSFNASFVAKDHRDGGCKVIAAISTWIVFRRNTAQTHTDTVLSMETPYFFSIGRCYHLSSTAAVNLFDTMCRCSALIAFLSRTCSAKVYTTRADAIKSDDRKCYLNVSCSLARGWRRDLLCTGISIIWKPVACMSVCPCVCVWPVTLSPWWMSEYLCVQKWRDDDWQCVVSSQKKMINLNNVRLNAYHST